MTVPRCPDDLWTKYVANILADRVLESERNTGSGPQRQPAPASVVHTPVVTLTGQGPPRVVPGNPGGGNGDAA